jgi:hypothetical protein
VNVLDAMGIFYIIPLKRNSKLKYYSADGDKHFLSQDHPAFYRKYSRGNHTILKFRDGFSPISLPLSCITEYTHSLKSHEMLGSIALGMSWGVLRE